MAFGCHFGRSSLAAGLLSAVLAAALPHVAAAQDDHAGHATADHAFDPAELDAATLPGRPTASLESRPLLHGQDGLGHETRVFRTVRAPGTRAPIHFHDAGGTSCVIEGEMTLYLAGAEPQRAVAGDCYYMPPGRPMTGANTGTVDAVLLDIFTVPVGTPVWYPVEPVEGGAEGAQFAD